MWDEPTPTWRKAQKQHQCQGDGCTKIIAPGERYLDRFLRHPTNSHLRYCQECAVLVIGPDGDDYHYLNGRNAFPDRYQQRMTSANWKTLKRKVIEQRDNRCERCEKESASLHLHHVHYRSLGSEQPEDVELLCPECHTEAHPAPAAKGWPKIEEGLIVGPDGEARWGKIEPDKIYIPLGDGRYMLAMPSLERKGKS